MSLTSRMHSLLLSLPDKVWLEISLLPLDAMRWKSIAGFNFNIEDLYKNSTAWGSDQHCKSYKSQCLSHPRGKPLIWNSQRCQRLCVDSECNAPVNVNPCLPTPQPRDYAGISRVLDTYTVPWYAGHWPYLECFVWKVTHPQKMSRILKFYSAFPGHKYSHSFATHISICVFLRIAKFLYLCKACKEGGV